MHKRKSNNALQLITDRSRLGDLDLDFGTVMEVGVGVLNLADNLESLNNLSKDDMTTIQPVSPDSRNEELGGRKKSCSKGKKKNKGARDRDKDTRG